MTGNEEAMKDMKNMRNAEIVTNTVNPMTSQDWMSQILYA